MLTEIDKVLKHLGLKDIGTYEDLFYIYPINSSDEYATMHTKLDQVAENGEYPGYAADTAKNITKITTYFELTLGDITYGLFLVGDFEKDEYRLRIKELN